MSGQRGVPWVLPLLFPAASAGGWAYLGEPGHAAGFGLMLAPALILGVLAPAVAASAEALPQLLIPSSWRIRWRHRSERRPSIPARLREAVYAADRHRCCFCKSPYQLQLDHVRPWSRGGLTALWNMVCLCKSCNMIKSNYWVARDGYVFYSPWQGRGDLATAAQILAFELRHRWNPGRWIRAGWSLSR